MRRDCVEVTATSADFDMGLGFGCFTLSVIELAHKCGGVSALAPGF